MPQPIFVDDFEWSVTAEDVLKHFKMAEDHAYKERIRELMDSTLQLARPRYFYMETPIEAITEDTVTIQGVTFTSKVLAKNLAEKAVVYPYLATSGGELMDYIEQNDLELIDQLYLDAVMELLVNKASLALDRRLTNLLPQGMISSVNPGSLVDWSITEQQPLFKLFGDAAAELGVRLSGSSLMDPIKSVSGIYYPTDKAFDNCMLCQRENCPDREAPFDEALYVELLEQ